MENYRLYFARIYNAAQRYYSLHLPGGLKSQEAQALRILSLRQQISQQKLADQLGIDKAGVTRLVRKLEAEGYLMRTVDPNDRRQRLLSPTPQADAEKEHGTEVTGRFYAWLLEVLSPEELEQFTATLKKLSTRALEERRNHFAALKEEEPCT